MQILVVSGSTRPQSLNTRLGPSSPGCAPRTP